MRFWALGLGVFLAFNLLAGEIAGELSAGQEATDPVVDEGETKPDPAEDSDKTAKDEPDPKPDGEAEEDETPAQSEPEGESAEDAVPAKRQVRRDDPKPEASVEDEEEPVQNRFCTKERAIIFFNGSVTQNTASRLISVITNMDNYGVEEVWIIIDSGGGSFAAASNFYEFSKVSPVKIKTYSTGRVQSAAVTIFLSGKERIVSPSVVFLLHPAAMTFGSSSGRMTQEFLANQNVWNKIIDDHFLTILKEVTGKEWDPESPYLASVDKYMNHRDVLKFDLATGTGSHPFVSHAVSVEISDDKIQYWGNLANCNAGRFGR